MKRSLLFILAAVILGIFLQGNAKVCAEAETAFSEIRFLTGQHGIGVKALAMGGAFVGIADDYSAVYWNPGGLAFNKKFEIFGSLSTDRARSSATVFNTPLEVSQSFTRLNTFGLLSPIPVSRGGFSLAFGINRQISYNGVLSIEGFNDSPDDQVFQKEDITEEGGVHTATLAGGIEVAKGVGVGVAVSYWFGSHEYNSLFSEYDDLNLYTLDQYNNNQLIDSRIKGVDLTVGLLYQPSRYLQLGMTITTPQYFSISEEYEVTEDYFYDEDTNLDDEFYIDDGIFDYEVVLPYKFGFGMAFASRFVTIGGALEYRDWSQTRYLSEPPVSGLSRVRANRDIRTTARSVLSKRVGMELNLGMLPAALRAGYAEIPSPYKSAPNSHTQKNLSFGFHILLAKQVTFDITYLHSWWDSRTVDDLISSIVLEERSENRVLAGITVRF